MYKFAINIIQSCIYASQNHRKSIKGIFLYIHRSLCSSMFCKVTYIKTILNIANYMQGNYVLSCSRERLHSLKYS